MTKRRSHTLDQSTTRIYQLHILGITIIVVARQLNR